MPDIKVSIIVPVYNAEKYLERCLDSLTNQTLKDIEIILVDDASRDSSPYMCDRASESDARIKVIHKCNEGAGMARNSGLKVATGEYIGFVDSDDYVEPEMYERLYDAAQKHSADLVMSGVRYVGGVMFSDEDSVEYDYFEADTLFSTREDIKNLRLGIVGALPCEKDDSRYGMSVWKNLFRREIVEKNALRFMSERQILSEDALFMLDYAACTRKAVGIKGAFYNYCRNGDSISKAYKADRFEKSLAFIQEIEKRLSGDIPREEYSIYLDRFVQAICRIICSQEIMHASESGVKYSELKARLKAICTHEAAASVLGRYPIGKLPLKQAVFAFAMKHGLYWVQRLVVGMRSR